MSPVFSFLDKAVKAHEVAEHTLAGKKTCHHAFLWYAKKKIDRILLIHISNDERSTPQISGYIVPYVARKTPLMQ